MLGGPPGLGERGGGLWRRQSRQTSNQENQTKNRCRPGSRFRTKSCQDLLSVAWYSLVAVILFPLHRSWWIKKTNSWTYLSGCVVYIFILLNLWLYYHNLCVTLNQYCDNIGYHDLYEPILVFAILAFLKCQITAATKVASWSLGSQEGKGGPRTRRYYSAWSCSSRSLKGRRLRGPRREPA